MALEVGTHSPWVSRCLEAMGHEVIVANARKLRMIYASEAKTDRSDAQKLARVARMDPKLLSPLRHCSEQAQADRAVIFARNTLVSLRTKLINHVRGSVKSFGGRLPSCSTVSFHKRVAASIPGALKPAIGPLLDQIEEVTRRIKSYDSEIVKLSRERYPETERLWQVPGVGVLTALTFVLIIEDPSRFARSRDVAPYLGLVPKRDQSGSSSKQLGITKTGDREIRRLLVQGAQYIFGPLGPDCDLRRWAHQLAERGGKNARKRAIVALARKLSILLHRLWVSGERYRPLRQTA